MAIKDKYKVLIVDDDQFISEMYLLKFKSAGFEADSAHDGPTAIEKIREQKPDIVLLDIILPNMDGFDILKALAQENLMEGRKIVLLSNLGEKKDVEKGLSLGAHDYIVKAHFTPSEVVEKVQSILQK